MELESHCSLQECSLLDFLPFTCTACLKIYCKNHRFPDSHNCSNWSQVDKTLLICRKCNQILNSCEEEFLDEHLKLSCTIGVYKQDKSPECNLGNCKNKSFINCKNCDLFYCIAHRHLEDHKCKSLGAQGMKDSPRVKLPVVPLSNSTVKKTGKRNSMVELMKLKAKACGDAKIPVSDRVYFTITLMESSKEVVMFFSKGWTVGKIIDKIALLNNIPNFNNSPSRSIDVLIFSNYFRS